MKKMLPGQLRFIVKQINKLFRVYDRAGGSFPYQTPELGVVAQDLPEAEAQAEADRLNEIYVVKKAESKQKEAPKKQVKRTGSFKSGSAEQIPAPAAKTPAPPVEEIIEEVEGYGDMTDEERKAYTDGLFEEVKY